MADIKISQLPTYLNASIHGGDSIPIVDSFAAELKQITMAQLDLRYTGVPDGGTTQQVLAKASGTNKDVYWKSLSKNDVGLGLVDNTSDANKPISTATNAALALKANTSALATKADTSYVNTQLGNKQDKLPVGVDGEVLTLSGGVPVWLPSGGGPGAVTSVFGRTGNVTAQVGDYDKTQIGLDQVDNTSDMDKPISTLTGIALAGKEPSLPAGSNGQVLTLTGGTPAWATPSTGIPNGGTTGQALTKNSATNGDVGWSTIEPAISDSTTQTLAAAATVTLQQKQREIVKIQSTGGAAAVTLPNGTKTLQELYIKGMSDVNPCTIADSSNTYVGGEISFTNNIMKYLIWDGAKWILVGA